MRKESLKRDTANDSSRGDNSDADDNEQQPLANGRAAQSSADPFDALVASKPPTSSKPNSASTRKLSPVVSPTSSPTFGGTSTNDNDDVSTVTNDANASTNDGNGSANGGTDVDGNGVNSTDTNDAEADADGGYEVEEIVDHQYKGKSKKLYKIRWKNYGPDDDTWEPENSLSCPELIARYLETHPDTRPPKKEKKPKKVKPAVDAVPRDTPKRAAIKESIVESDDGGASVDSGKHEKKSQPKKSNAKNKKRPNEEYEVEKIVEDRQSGKGETIFRIRWKGYGATQDTWEPRAALSCNELIKKYWANKKKKASAAEDTTEYDVEKIVGHKVEHGQESYWVKWKGYPESENTWQSASDVNCHNLVEAYKTKYFSSAPATNGKLKSALKRPAPGNKKNNKAATAKKGKYQKKKVTKILPDSDDSDDNSYASDNNDDEEDDDNTADDDDDDGEKDPLGETNDKEWDVADIIDERQLKGKKEYLIRWKGCDIDQDTWEPASNVHCPDIIAKFEKRQASGNRKLSGEKSTKRVSIKLPSQPRKSSRRA